MRDAGIFDGDLVVVEYDVSAAPGDVVVAVVDGEMTVKTLCRDRTGNFWLEAAHPDFAPIHPRATLNIVGVVISVARRLRR